MKAIYKDSPLPVQIRALLLFRILVIYFIVILPIYMILNASFYWSYPVSQILIAFCFLLSMKSLFQGNIDKSGDMFYVSYIANYIVVLFPGSATQFPENPQVMFRVASLLILFMMVIFLISVRKNQIYYHMFASVITLSTRYLILITLSNLEPFSTLYYFGFSLFLVLIAALISYLLVKYYQSLAEVIKEQDSKIMKSLTQIIDGFVPICANCKAIRKNPELWIPIEKYISDKSGSVNFTHGLCPGCAQKLYPELLEG